MSSDLLSGAASLATQALESFTEACPPSCDFDLHTILPREAIAQLARLQQRGQLVLQHSDLNHDGHVDRRDLPYVLQAIEGTNMNSLPPALQAALTGLLDSNGDGEINEADLLPLIQALDSDPTGHALLAIMQQPNDACAHPPCYDANQLVQAYSSILQLGTQTAPTDGTLDLSHLRPEVRQVLLDHLDLDHDGALTPADVATFLIAITRERPSPPPAVASPLSPPQPSPQPSPPQPLSPGQSLPDPSGSGGSGAGPVVGGLFGAIALLALAFFGYRYYAKKKSEDRRRMISSDAAATACGGAAPYTSNYAAPMPTPLVAGGAPITTSEMGSTHNTAAVERARAANLAPGPHV